MGICEWDLKRERMNVCMRVNVCVCVIGRLSGRVGLNSDSEEG